MSSEALKARARNWACCVYADSAPENWRDIISSWHVPAFISPYHDQDVNPTGEPKKPHWHVMIMMDSVISPEQARKYFKQLGAEHAERVGSVRGYARYLCHLDNPDKARYNPEDVMCLGGADYPTICNLEADRFRAVREIIAFIRENHIKSYYQLMNICADQYPEWFRVLVTGSSYVIQLYLKSHSEEISKCEKDILSGSTK